MQRGLEIVRRALDGKRRRALLAGLLLAALALALVLPESRTVRAAFHLTAHAADTWLRRGLALAGAVAALLCLARFARTPAAGEHPLTRLLTVARHEILWVHDGEQDAGQLPGVRRRRRRRVHFLTADPAGNQRIALAGADAEELMAEIPGILPEAVLGYSAAKRAAYQRSPAHIRAFARGRPVSEPGIGRA